LKPNAWNRYVIEANANHIRLWINDTLMADTVHEGAAEGHIGLQLYGPTDVYFRDQQIRSFP
jgi:hypothetical protein